MTGPRVSGFDHDEAPRRDKSPGDYVMFKHITTLVASPDDKRRFRYVFIYLTLIVSLPFLSSSVKFNGITTVGF